MRTIAFILTGTALAGGIFREQGLAFSVKGLILVLCSALTYATYIVANSRISSGVDWLPKSTMIMTGSAITIFMVNANTVVSTIHPDQQFMLAVLFMAVVGTTIPTALFAAGIPKVGAGVSAILMTIELPVAIVCAGLVLGESIDYLQLIGIVIMLAAIVAMNYYKIKARNH
ncbi:DMT family transporter [Chitinophaga horti]|uniref:DMT family transporter n=1 Tax=Chitinophaga horti TaxID=2920382 RepID=A0ABY6JC00_9BACT|nr:DMT family transporter [Chitinophaga horti]UYQ95724.1 DMT family transporter [Chitinophaga horti]